MGLDRILEADLPVEIAGSELLQIKLLIGIVFVGIGILKNAFELDDIASVS